MPEGDTIHRARGADERGARRQAARARRRAQPALAASQPRRRAQRRDARGGGGVRQAPARPLLRRARAPQPPGDERPLVVAADGRLPVRQARGCGWPRAAAIASQNGGKILRLVSESRAAQRPGALRRLGPDPLRPGLRAPRRRRSACGGSAPEREIGDALLDQEIIAGIGNAIRIEALLPGPGRARGARSRTSTTTSSSCVVAENERVMRTSIAKGRRPRAIYRANRTAAARAAAARSRSRGQGDDNRTAYWCPACQA